MRGARGALWTRGANSLDRATLLAALLRASGVTSVRFAHAQLTNDQIVRLGRAMLPAPSRAFGCPTGFPYDPAGDGVLFNLLRDHYWVEYDTGGGFVAADTSFADFTLGQTVAAALDHFTDIPANLRYRVTVKLDVETYSQASAAFALSPFGTTTVLTQAFDAADLVGKPLSVSAFVHATGGASIPFSATTFTYTPYLLLGQGDASLDDDPIVVGSDFQDVYTNFPLGSQLVTGLTLSVDLQPNPFSAVQHLERRIYDRVGFATRQLGGPVDVSGTPAPAVTDFDVTTVDILPSRMAVGAFGHQRDRLAAVQSALQALQPGLAGVTPGGPYTADQLVLLRQLSDRARAVAIVNAETLTMGYLATADAAEAQLARGYLVRPVVDSPRVILAISSKHGDDATLELDVQRNALRVFPLTGQMPSVTSAFEVARGLEASFLEGAVIAQVTGQSPVSIREVFQAVADSPTNQLAVITGDDLDVLAGLSLSAEAKARIANAAADRKVIVTPTEMVTVGGQTTVGWLETEDGGRTISAFEHGGHQALVGYAGSLEFSAEFNKPIANFIGKVAAFGQVGLVYTAAVLEAVAEGGGFDGTIKDTKTSIKDLIKKVKEAKGFFDKLKKAYEKLKLDTKGFGLIGELAKGLTDGFDMAERFFDFTTPADPPAFPFLVSDLRAGDPPVTPGAQPGVDVTLAPDPIFTIDSGGTQVPSVFRARVRNTGPVAASFALTFPIVPPGFALRAALSPLPVGAGETGEVSVCATPNGDLAAPGTPATLSLKAAGGGAEDTDSEGFIVPAVGAVALTLSPAEASVTPGGATAVTLGLRALGNVATSVDLTLSSPTGVTLTGLSSPVTLGGGAIASQALVAGVGAGVAAGTDVVVTATASFGAPSARQQVTQLLVLHVVTSSTQCAQDAAGLANAIGRTGLGDVLASLGGAAIALGADPASAPARASALAYLDRALQLLDGPAAFAQGRSELQAVRSALASAAPGAVPGVLANLNLALCHLRGVFDGADTHDFGLVINPNTREILPDTPTTFAVTLANQSNATRTFTLGLNGLPPGVTGQVSPSSITLGPFSSNFPPVTVTIDPIASALAPFDVTVTAADALAPVAQRAITASITVRRELVQVVDVTPTPGFAEPGATVSVRVRLYNAVNRTRGVDVYVGLRNPSGQDVIYPFFAGKVALDVSANIQQLDVPVPLPANLARGPYRFTALVRDGDPIPGATGEGPFFVGSPLAATITVAPQLVGPGTSTVQTTLAIQRDAVPNPSADLLGAVQTEGGIAKSVAVNGNYAYVCGETLANVIDVSNPQQPLLARSFGTYDAQQAGNFSAATCTVFNGHLIIGFDTGFEAGGAFVPLRLAVYSLADPSSPSFVSQTTIQRQVGAGPAFFTGAVGWIPTSIYFYNPFSGFIFEQFGDVFGVDFSNLASPTLRGRLFPPLPTETDQGRIWGGGENMVFGALSMPGSRGYVATTTSVDGAPEVGQGKLLVTDLSNPDLPSIGTQLIVPEARLLQGMAADGTRVLVSGDTRGFYDGRSGYVGTTTLSLLDATNPASPTVSQTLVTPLTDKDGTTIVSLGGSRFAVGGPKRGDQPVLVLVDTSNPSDLRYIPYDVGAPISSMQRVGNLLYTTSSLGLTIYQLEMIDGPRLTARVQVPTGTGVTLVPGSFSLPPTSVSPEAGHDTYVWDQPADDTITWSQQVASVAAGTTRTVVSGGALDYTVPALGAGTLPLPAAFVQGTRVVGIDPPIQTFVRVGTPATYTVSVKNPTGAPATFLLDVTGVPPEWVSLPSSVDVPAGASVQVPLTLTSDLAAQTYRNVDFSVVASGAGLSDQVFATLQVWDPPDLGPNNGAQTFGLVLDATPSTLVTGRGTAARFVARFTNVGNVADSYTPSLQAPAGWSVSASPAGGLVTQPGPANAREALIQLVPPQNATPGIYDVPIVVFSNGGNLGPKATVRVTVSGSGVSVLVLPFTGTPADHYVLRVRNTGTVSDTFALALAGVMGPVSMLASPTVTLAPNEQQDVPISLGGVPPVPPGTIQLIGGATSQSEPAVAASAAASVTLPVSKGLAAALIPAERERAGPGTVAFALQVQNTGNVEDTYSASITGTGGGLTAALRGPGGAAAQSVSPLRLPAFAGGGLTLDASLATLGDGTVTVEVASLTDASRTATVTARLRVVEATTTTTTSPSTTSSSTTITPTTTISPSTMVPTTVSTTTIPTTTTTRPESAQEICGNCEDDDGNGLTDFEDPACCGAGAAALPLKRVRLTPKKGATKLQLSDALTGPLAPAQQHLEIQMRAAGGDEVLCARIPAGGLAGKKTTFRWRDRTGAAPGASGLQKVQLRVSKKGTAKMTAAGKAVRMQTPAPGRIQVTIGLQGTTPPDAPGRCLSTTAVFAAKGKKGALKFP